MKKPLLLLNLLVGGGLAAWPSPAEPCLAPASETIYARDLAPAIPEFAQLPADLSLGYAPTPGLERVLLAASLQRIAREHHLEVPVRRNVCFAWPVAALAKERILAAMQATLAGRQCQIEILDQNRAPAPAGDLLFPLQGLTALSDKPVIWRGYVAFTPTRKFSTWALVRVRVTEKHLIAVKPIRYGGLIDEASFRTETYEGPLLREEAVTALGKDSELRAAHDIAAGTTLFTNMLALPKEVQRGDTVTVIVDSGAAHLEAHGLALQEGSSGNVIMVKNSQSGSLFKARVLGKGRVLVIPGILSGLVVTAEKKL